jgi:hypothetical protein
MPEPGDAMAGYLRASHADREHVIGALKTAFAAGLLAKDEFDLRIDRTLTSRTYADLAGIIAGLAMGPPRPKAARPLTRTESVAAWGVGDLVVSAILTVVIIPAGTTRGVVVSTALIIYAVAWLLAAIMMLAVRRRG